MIRRTSDRLAKLSQLRRNCGLIFADPRHQINSDSNTKIENSDAPEFILRISQCHTLREFVTGKKTHIIGITLDNKR